MSCNCNTANPNCEPCAICTPPGVVNLPDCNPVPKCEEIINLECINWSGQDYPCLDIYKGDDLVSVLFKVFGAQYPSAVCCLLEGNINNSKCLIQGFGYPVYPTTTTSSTTSTTSSTTTTTTVAPTCSYYQITNTYQYGPSYISYTDCCGVEITNEEVRVAITVCANNSYPIITVTGSVTSQNSGPCSLFCPPTTTTTTVPFVCECETYSVTNNTNNPYVLNFLECYGPGLYNAVAAQIGKGVSILICACNSIEEFVPPTGIVITSLGIPCSSPDPTTTSTTSTSTTSTSTTSTTTSSTTTTTTVAPCQCYLLTNDTLNYISYSYIDCNTLVTSYSAIAPNKIAYRCAIENSIVASPLLTISSPLGLCSQVECGVPECCTLTYARVGDIAGAITIEYVDCQQNIKQLNFGPDEEVNGSVCFLNDSNLYKLDGPVQASIDCPCIPTTTSTSSTTTTSTTTAEPTTTTTTVAPTTLSFDSNQTNIIIPSSGTPVEYPVTFTVSGITSPSIYVEVELINYSHTYPADISMYLSSPTGLYEIVLTNGLGSSAAVNANVLFSQALTPWDGYSSGTFGPITVVGAGQGTAFVPPAPNGGINTGTYPDLTIFNGMTETEINGVWNLWIRDVASPDNGSLGQAKIWVTF